MKLRREERDRQQGEGVRNFPPGWQARMHNAKTKQQVGPHTAGRYKAQAKQWETMLLFTERWRNSTYGHGIKELPARMLQS